MVLKNFKGIEYAIMKYGIFKIVVFPNIISS